MSEKEKTEKVEKTEIKKDIKEKAKQTKTEKSKVAKQNKNEKKIKQLEEKNIETLDSYKRLAAEFDNYRKRTLKEKDSIYADAINYVIENFLPVIDSFELADQNVHKSNDVNDVLKGFELVYRQFNEVLEKIGVEAIDCIDQDFNPELHNAVMHIEDEKYQENKVIEELQKGYIYKDKVIRHSMVKVAN